MSVKFARDSSDLYGTLKITLEMSMARTNIVLFTKETGTSLEIHAGKHTQKT